MAKTIQVPKLSVVDMLVNELGAFPQVMSAPVTMAGMGQITMPLEITLTSDTIAPILEFAVTLKMTAPASGATSVLSNIRSIKVEHEKFKDANGLPKVYTLDTATLLDGAKLATALLSDPSVKADETYQCIDPTVAGQASGSEVSTTYTARVALPFKLPAGKLTVTLNCQDATTYVGTILDFTARRAILICPRRTIPQTGVYIACDSRRISGLSTFRFDQSAQMFAVIGSAAVDGGILDISGTGQPAQIGSMTMTQVTEQVGYYAGRLPTDSNLEMVVCIDDPIPAVNRPTQMSLSLFRYDVFY